MYILYIYLYLYIYTHAHTDMEYVCGMSRYYSKVVVQFDPQYTVLCVGVSAKIFPLPNHLLPT